MRTDTGQKLRDQLLECAQGLGARFTARALREALPEPWPSSAVERAIAELIADRQLTQVRQYPQRLLVAGRPPQLADPAPDWGRGYPSAGNLIGPTWQAMWQAMADGEWHDVRELLGVGEAARGCATATVRNLLFAAAKAELIEGEERYDASNARYRTWYRRQDQYRAVVGGAS